MKTNTLISKRVAQIPRSAIHEMTRLSKDVDDVAFLSWAKPTTGAPEHIREGVIASIKKDLWMVILKIWEYWNYVKK